MNSAIRQVIQMTLVVVVVSLIVRNAKGFSLVTRSAADSYGGVVRALKS